MNNPEYDVLVCHGSPDKPFVRKLVSDLCTLGISAWLDALNVKIGDSIVG
jgi:hypothetical protein